MKRRDFLRRTAVGGSALIIGETLPEGQPLPNLADLLQECCDKLLEQVCMPVQGG